MLWIFSTTFLESEATQEAKKARIEEVADEDDIELYGEQIVEQVVSCDQDASIFPCLRRLKLSSMAVVL